MTADDEQTRLQALAVLALTKACFKLGRKFNVCPLCLLYATADAAEDAEVNGDAQHGQLCDTPGYIHPPHQTIV
jgi:hypothetical protein